MWTKSLLTTTILMLTLSTIIITAASQINIGQQSGCREDVVDKVKELLSTLFRIDTARYRLDTIVFNGNYSHNNMTIKNYLLVFKDNNNKTLIIDASIMDGEITRLEIVGQPPINNYRRTTCLTIKQVGGAVIIPCRTIKTIINHTISAIAGTPRSISRGVIEILKNILSATSNCNVILSRRTNYKYDFMLGKNYTLSLILGENQEDNEPKELIISLQRKLSLPLNITYTKNIIYLHYYIVKDYLYCTIYSYNPLITNIIIKTPEYLHHINEALVIRGAQKILTDFLVRSGIKNYRVISIIPTSINIKEYVRNKSLIIIPGDNLVLRAVIKTEHMRRYYIVYLNLDTMKGFVKGEYFPVNQVEETNKTGIHVKSYILNPGQVALIITMIAVVSALFYIIYHRRPRMNK